jgi:hypothetical protein
MSVRTCWLGLCQNIIETHRLSSPSPPSTGQELVTIRENRPLPSALPVVHDHHANPQYIHSPMLGLNERRVDADGTGKLRERSTRNVDSLTLHLEAVVGDAKGVVNGQFQFIT